jgi:hypothetical protein
MPYMNFENDKSQDTTHGRSLLCIPDNHSQEAAMLLGLIQKRKKVVLLYT